MPSSSSILWYLILIEDVRCVATGTAFNGDSQMSDRQFRIGVVGLGTAARMMLPAIAAHRGMVLAAVADPVTEVRESVGVQWGVPAFDGIESLVAAQHLDAVYIAT